YLRPAHYISVLLLQPYTPYAPCVSFFHHTATTEIYTLSLHDALPIFDDGGISAHDVIAPALERLGWSGHFFVTTDFIGAPSFVEDRKSTRLNSSHVKISYAVFCLKKKRTKIHKYANTKHKRLRRLQSN